MLDKFLYSILLAANAKFKINYPTSQLKLNYSNFGPLQNFKITKNTIGEQQKTKRASAA